MTTDSTEVLSEDESVHAGRRISKGGAAERTG